MELFDSRFPGRTGGAALFNGQKAGLYTPELAQKRLTPCSTFKLYLSLFGLESGVIRSPKQVWRYNGEKRGRVEWRKDMDLTVALRESSEWYFREVARKLGAQQLKEQVAKLGYGSGWNGTKPEDAWIDGTLTISPKEQAELVWKLEQETLPFAKAHQRAVKDALRVGEAQRWALWGKTGSSAKDKNGLSLGWYVGAYKENGRTHAFAVVERAPGIIGPDVRKKLVRQLKNA